jgi:aryl-alcohol dehydrogenase-like predicted oxidoreductase
MVSLFLIIGFIDIRTINNQNMIGDNMHYKLLGKSGLRVSELCLGAMTFGKDWGWGAEKKESRHIYDTFIGAGGNFIDTADFYTKGTSEKYVGEFISDHRERIVLATKYTNSPPGKDPNAGGNHRKNMIQSVEASLKRLRTDYIDLYWLHIWEYTTPVEEVMRAFEDLVRAGKVLYIGISDTPAWIVSRANMLAELRGWAPFIGIQIEYSLIQRTVEREFLPMARELDLGVLAWGPLASGLLTGKYKKLAEGQIEGEGRLAQRKGHSVLDDRKILITNTLLKVAEEVGRPPSQVALNWLRQRPGVVIPIVGASKLSQVQDNLACLDFKLEEAHLQKLDEVSRMEPGFPYEFAQKESTQEFAFGGLHNQIINHREK